MMQAAMNKEPESLAQTFADERQHGGIGEMEQGDCRRWKLA